LTAAQRVLGRLGGKKKPNQLDVTKLILKEAITANNTFRGMLDAYRFSLQLPPLELSAARPLVDLEIEGEAAALGEEAWGSDE
jgi:hypothetical protein